MIPDRDDLPRHRLRSDAEQNRSKVLEAARRLYAVEGLDISMAAVAREAGVGKATLARRFPNREALVAEVFIDHMRRFVDATAEALEDPDPWRGFAGYIETVLEMQANDRGFADVLTMTLPGAPELETLRARSYTGFQTLITRAKASGRLRDDFESEDLVLALMANAGVATATARHAPDAWRRLSGHLLRAFANPGAALPDMPAAPSGASLSQAMYGTPLPHAAEVQTPARSRAPGSTKPRGGARGSA
jgi:AcrR family transcriptional regulator